GPTPQMDTRNGKVFRRRIDKYRNIFRFCYPADDFQREWLAGLVVPVGSDVYHCRFGAYRPFELFGGIYGNHRDTDVPYAVVVDVPGTARDDNFRFFQPF